MRVGHTNTECHAFSANITFSHTIGTSFWIRPIKSGVYNYLILADVSEEIKPFFKETEKF